MLGVWGDDMVLQHDQPRVHGCGAPAHHAMTAHVSVPGSGSANATVARATADANGCFVIALEPTTPALSAAAPSSTIEVKLAVGQATSPYFATAVGVRFGTVVLCAGQSNVRTCTCTSTGPAHPRRLPLAHTGGWAARLCW